MVAMRAPFRLALRLLLGFLVLWGGWQVWYRVELRRYQTAMAPILAEVDTPLPPSDAAEPGTDDAARYYSAAAVAANAAPTARTART